MGLGKVITHNGLTWASWLMAAGLVLWLLAQVDLLMVKTTVIHLGWLGLALLSVVATLVLRVIRWRGLLLGLPGTQPSWTSLWRATLWGQGLNLLLPIRVGDLARAHGIRRTGQMDTAYALGTLGAEKLLDLACLGTAVIFLFQMRSDLVTLLPPTRVWLPLLLLSGAWIAAWPLSRISFHNHQCGSTWWSAPFNKWLPAQPVGACLSSQSEAVQDPSLPFGGLIRQKLQHGAAGLNVLRQPVVIGSALAWSLPLWLGHVFNNYATAKALALPLDWSGALLILVVLQVGLAPPSTPAKMGVFPALCIASLGLLGYSSTVGLVYGLILQWVVMLPPLVLLLLDLWLERIR